MKKFSQTKMERILNKALKLLYKYDNNLFMDKDEECKILTEEVLTHRLAVYVEKILNYTIKKKNFLNSEISVDCEYSNYLNGVKCLKNLLDGGDDIVSKAFEKPYLTYKHETTGKELPSKIYPDIVVHKRFSNDTNILMVECKKYGGDYMKEKNKNVKKDLVKLSICSNGYDHVYFIFLGKNKGYFKRIIQRFEQEQELNDFQRELLNEARNHKMQPLKINR